MFSLKSFFSSLLIALSLMTSSSSVFGKEKEVQLSMNGCMIMAQLVESLAHERNTVSKNEQYDAAKAAGLEGDHLGVVRKIINLVYEKNASSGEEFLNWCVKNQGRIRIEEEKDI